MPSKYRPAAVSEPCLLCDYQYAACVASSLIVSAVVLNKKELVRIQFWLDYYVLHNTYYYLFVIKSYF